MVRLTDRQEGWQPRGQTLKRLTVAIIVLAGFILANVFFTHSWGGWHFGNIYMARTDAVSGMFTIWAVEFAFFSLLAWNWQATRNLLLRFLGLCILASIGVAAVVAMFADLVPIFRLPQALLLTFLMGYLQIVGSSAIQPIGPHNPRLGEKDPHQAWQGISFRIVAMFGAAIIIVLYSLVGERESVPTAIAYGLCAVMGSVCAVLVRSCAYKNAPTTDG
jgi:hypothetical protein